MEGIPRDRYISSSVNLDDYISYDLSPYMALRKSTLRQFAQEHIEQWQDYEMELQAASGTIPNLSFIHGSLRQLLKENDSLSNRVVFKAVAYQLALSAEELTSHLRADLDERFPTTEEYS